MTARVLYCRHVVHSAGSDGNTEWRFLTSCPQVLRVLKECLWEHFTHQNEQDKYPLYRSHSAHNMRLRRIQNLNGFSIGFFCSHSAHNVTLRHILRLPTSVGFAQARPNYFNYFASAHVRIMHMTSSLNLLKLIRHISEFYHMQLDLVCWRTATPYSFCQ